MEVDGLAGLIEAAVISYTVFAASLAALPAGRRILRNAVAITTILRRKA